MNRTLIEFGKSGICNFDYFCIDSGDSTFTLGERTFEKGQTVLDVCSLDKDFVTELVKLGADLFFKYNRTMQEDYSVPLYREIRERIFSILDTVKNVAPFCYFNVADSRTVVSEVFSEERLADYEQMFSTHEAEERTGKLFRMTDALMSVYIYLCLDTANFGTLALNFTHYAVENNCRRPSELANMAAAFFSDERMADELKRSNPLRMVEGVSLRPRATVAPVIVDNADGELEIKRRVYYGRMMDFFVADLFEGLACGHYLWRCGYCGRYFLMTTAHRQLYCQMVAPGNRYPCSVLAKHHKTATEHAKANKQSLTANPIYILYKQRDNSIRKDKSRGKYDADTCDRAKAYAKNCYERALGDPAYAQKQYPIDMVLENIYKNA